MGGCWGAVQSKDKDSQRAVSDLTKAEATTKQLATELTRERRMVNRLSCSHLQLILFYERGVWNQY